MKRVTAFLALVLALALAAGCVKQDATGQTAGRTQGGETEPADQQSALIAPDFTTTLTNGDTFTLSEQRGKVVVVNFWATWCGPCVAMGPVVDRIAEEYGDRVVIGKYNIDEQGDLASEYRIMSIPTILFFKDGKKTAIRLAGSQTDDTLRAKVEELLAL